MECAKWRNVFGREGGRDGDSGHPEPTGHRNRSGARHRDQSGPARTRSAPRHQGRVDCLATRVDPFRTDRLRAVTSLVQPFLFLFVLGTGLSTLAGTACLRTWTSRLSFTPACLPCRYCFTAIFSAASIVWDREFGFLREMLVAPVSRGSLVVGKCLGGATIATFQGFVFLALAGFAHVPYNAVLFLTLIGELLLLAFTLTAFGVMMAARIKQFQAFMALTQMLVLPLFFLSGALYPLNGLPSWLSVLTRIDPLTYVVGPMRHAVFSHLGLPPEVVAKLAPGVTWGSWPVPVGLSLGIVAVMGLR